MLISFFNTRLLFNRLHHVTLIVIATMLHLSTFEFKFYWLIIPEIYCAMSVAPLPKFSNVNWLNSHKKTLTVWRSAITLQIGDSVIAGLSHCSNNWKRYSQPLNAVNYGVLGCRMQNILRRCRNLPSSP